MHSLRTLPLLRPSRSASPNPNGTHEARSSTPAPPATTSTTALGTATPLTANSSAGLGKISNSTSGNVGLKPVPGRASEEDKVGRSVSMGGQPRGRSTGAGRLVMGLGGLNLSGTAGGNAPPGAHGHVELAPSPTPTLNGAGSTVSNGHVHPTTPLLRGNTTQISPPGSRAGTPLPPSTPLLGGQDGASIDAIGLRLNELVNKATFGVDLKAGRGMKKGLGWGLGEAVVKELPAPQADAYLIRAVLRASVKSLTIYGSRLEYFLLPAFTSTEFQAPVNLRPAPTPALAPPVLNMNQSFALSICHAAWETCEVLEVALETTAYPKFVVDTLRPIMDKFDSIVARVVMPLMGSIKKDLISSFSAEGSSSPPGHSKGLPAANGVTLPASLPAKAVSHIPGGLRTFASKVDAARRAFDLICKDCREDGETWVASVVVAVVWKGLCVCTARYDPDQKLSGTGRPPSPEAIHRALASLAKDGVGPQPAVPSTSTVGGAVGKMAGAMLPSRTASRPPSPPRGAIRLDTLGGVASGSAPSVGVVALASFEALVQRLVTGLVQKPAPIAPAADDPTASEHLAREALDEALEAIASMKIILAALEKGHSYFCNVEKHLIDDIEMADEKDERVVDAIEDAPAVLLFALLAKRVNKTLTSLPTTAWAMRIRSPAAVFGITEEEYERQYLGAFGVAEERAKRVALAYKAEVERLSKEVAALSGPGVEEEKVREVKGWVKALAMGIEAMTGVVPVLAGH